MTTTQELKAGTASTTAVSDERRNLLEKLGLMHEVDVCTLCNVKSETLWTWRKEQRGPKFVKLGREICYRVDDLLAWIASNVVEFMQAETPMQFPAPANDSAAAAAA
ncbi:helix-turn-helix domain-containing protein [Methylobacterium sp. 285MFTsu5.1]|uniref:helix-turn-helix transcriptional regulator n=1 Tax=Methylobacterium sp. 285MFTsu5.1 TaxID=1172187 RepID=UPI00036F3CB4|nr:helix-turn-helix domain-containing protein [Methylobacterium sp. 285MFTsu5.1]